MTIAPYHTAALQRAKRLPSLASLLGKDRARRLTPEEDAERKRRLRESLPDGWQMIDGGEA